MSTLGASAAPREVAVSADRSLGATLRALLLPPATAVALLGLALLPLLSPLWIHAAMAASGGAAAGATLAQSQQLSDRTVHELLFGPATWAITTPDGRPLYGTDEIGHLADVRLVLFGFLGLALISGVFVGWSILRQRHDASTWHSVARGGALLAGTLVAAGIFAALAFGPAFELFHRLLFPGGNWAFDPAQSNLVRLYPLGFWQLSAAAFGALGIAGGLLAWWIGRRRAQSVAER